MQTDSAVEFAKKLIEFDSTSRKSNVPVAEFLSQTLVAYGFDVERIPYADKNAINKLNIVAKKGGGTGGLAYFAHCDVVPADDWSRNDAGAFDPIVVEDRLYGRGSCDMKGSIACMLTAISQIAALDFKAPFYFICTADEEAGFIGARHVVKDSRFFREMVEHQTHAMIGEPTLLNIVHGTKGIVGIRVVSRGRSAHSSTTEGVNANLPMIPFLHEMKKIHDDTRVDPNWRHHDFDPPTITWNIGVNDFTYAYNITPGQSVCTVSFRPMPGQNADILIDRVAAFAKACGLEFEVDSRGEPFYTSPDTDFIQSSLDLTRQSASKTVSYGTDGGEFAELHRMLVCGPGSIHQAHTSDEWISLDQLKQGVDIYKRFLQTHVIQ